MYVHRFVEHLHVTVYVYILVHVYLKEAKYIEPLIKTLKGDPLAVSIVLCICKFQPLKSKHLTNQDTFFRPKSVQIRDAPLSCVA